MAIILSQITVGDHKIMIVDSAPNVIGVEAPIGSMVIVEGQDAVWLKTGLNHTDWKISTVDKAALDVQLGNIEQSVSDEVSRAQAAEQVIADDLAQEILDRQAAVQGVQDQLDALDTNYATDAEVTAAVQAEADARILQDGVLQSNIDVVSSGLAQEITDRQAADLAESQARIDQDAILQDNINAEVSRATIAEGNLQNEIDQIEISSGLTTGGLYQQNPSANYISGALSLADADNYLDSALKYEENDRIAEDLTFLKLDGTRPMTDALNMGGHKVTFVHSPENASDAATKQYVDDLLAGLSWKEAVHSATVELENINLANPGTATIGGHLLVQGQRVLIKDQTDLTENGIYIFDSSSTALVRSSDANSWAELEGAVVYVQEGTNAGGKFVATIPPTGVIGVDDITFTMFSAANALDGVGTADTVAVWTDVHTLGSSLVTTQELEYVSGVTSGIQAQFNSLDGRLDVIEGIGEGSVAKAEQDAKDYADAAVLVETNARIADVDAEESARIAADALKVDKAGDTMTGALVIDESLGIVNTISSIKIEFFYDQGIDGSMQGSLESNVLKLEQVQSSSGTSTTVVTPANLNMFAEDLTAQQVSQVYAEALVDGSSLLRVENLVSNKQVIISEGQIELKSGGVASTPTLQAHAANKKYVDDSVAAVNVDIDALQVEVNNIESSVGLDSAGLYTPHTGSNYIDGATNMRDVDFSLDAAIKTVSDAVDAEEVRALAAEGLLDGRLDIIEGIGEGSVAKAEQDAKDYADAQDQIVLTTAASYTDDAIAALVDAAPALLDTLNELAAALGDDPNFATTVATQIGNIQSELDDTQLGAGLGTNGAYSAPVGSNYLGLASSLKDADSKLDAQIKVVADDLAQEVIDRAADVDAEEAARIAEDLTLVKLDGSRPMTGDLDMDTNDIVGIGKLGVGADVPETILHLEESTVKFTTRMVSSQTIGAVNSVMASVTPSTDSVELLKIKVIGIDIASHDSVSYERTVRVKNIANVVSLGTIQADYTSEDPGLAQANCTFVQNGDSIDIRVTGALGKTITWKAVVERIR